jgi:hypothetical protein
MPAAANLRVVSSVVANDYTLPRNLPWLSGREPSKLTFRCTAPDLASARSARSWRRWRCCDGRTRDRSWTGVTGR